MLNIGSLMLDGLDYVMIVDTNYNIVYNSRYDKNINHSSGRCTAFDMQQRYYFDVFPKLTREESNVVKCMETQEVIANKRQSYCDYLGRHYLTNNVALPLRSKGRLVAVVELVMDIGVNDAGEKLQPADKKFEDFVMKLKKEASLITFDTILTVNEQMKSSIEKAKILTEIPGPVLIYGETGTGKELFAQAMITYSRVPREKVIIQNCAAVPENLIEVILFGTEKGAYTGAETKKGLFEEADGGILFLDEINSIPYRVQSKLLRVIQEGTFRPLGAEKDRYVDVKVIGAMNIEPIEAIEKGIFRSDLFYRFSGGLITLLPLRERPEDINLYISYYIDYYNRAYNKQIKGISPKLRGIFLRYSWEGNVRELKNTIESMIISAEEDILTEKHLPKYILDILEQKDHEAEVNRLLEGVTDEAQDTIAYRNIMETVERKLIEEAMERAEGNKTKAGEILGIPRKTLQYRIEKLKLEE